MGDHASVLESVVIPGLQAGLTGVLAGGALAAAGVAFGWDAPLAAAGLGFSVTTLGAWLYFRAEWAGRIDPRPAAPPAPQPAREFAQTTRLVRLSVDWSDGHEGIFAELGVNFEQFRVWACGAAAGKSLGENHWCGAGRPFSKNEYHFFRDRCEFFNLVRQRGRHYSSGYQLTGKGRAICEEFARRYGSEIYKPSPTIRTYAPAD